MEPHPVAFPGVGVRELTVAVVSQGHVTAAALGELTHPAGVHAHRIAILDPDHRDLLALSHKPTNVVGRECETNLVRSDLLRQSVDRVELRDRLRVRVVEARLGQVSLPHIHDHPRHVEPTRVHLGQVHLIPEVRRIIPLGGEVRCADIVVRVERDYALMNALGMSQEICFRLDGRRIGCSAARREKCHGRKREGSRVVPKGHVCGLDRGIHVCAASGVGAKTMTVEAVNVRVAS